jgi:hypothetical protein
LPRICPTYKDSKKSSGLLLLPASLTFLNQTVSPENAPAIGLPWLKACFIEYYNQGVPLFHISLHSPTMTGDYYLKIIEELISFIAHHKNINFKFVSEIKEYPERRFKTDIFPYIKSINKNIVRTFFRKIVKTQKYVR